MDVPDETVIAIQKYLQEKPEVQIFASMQQAIQVANQKDAEAQAAKEEEERVASEKAEKKAKKDASSSN